MFSPYRRVHLFTCLFLCIGLMSVLGRKWFHSGGQLLGENQAFRNVGADTISQAKWFRVRGASMAPTLFGESQQSYCVNCGERNFFFFFDDAGATTKSLQCSRCSLSVFDSTDLSSTFAGDQVQVSSFTRRQDLPHRVLQRGDLIALKKDGAIHVKRLVAFPGEVVGTSGMHLTVNSVRIEDLLYLNECRFPVPWLTVNQDGDSETSAWKPETEQLPEKVGWNRTKDGHWIIASGDPSWMTYSPGSIGSQNVNSPVWDDYPFNVGISRKLFSIDRLQVSGVSLNSSWLTFGFWTRRGVRQIQRKLVAGQPFSINSFDAKEVTNEQFSVTPVAREQPIAIACNWGAAKIKNLKVERLVEYRLRPYDENLYPVSLSSDQCFVLGDNVPISVDSRDWGAISWSSVIGKVDNVLRLAE